MRLLDTHTGYFVERDPKDTQYAILSHTWDKEKGEQTYDQLKEIQRRQLHHEHSDRTGGSTATLASGSPPLSMSAAAPAAPSEQHNTQPLQLRLLPALVLKLCASRFILFLVRFLFPHDFIDSEPLYGNHRSTGPPELTPVPSSERSPPSSIWGDPELSPKIREACAIARANGFRYMWIDSCCIDKSSSTETSEAINSMYTWYKSAAICYAYLVDVPAEEDHRRERSSFRNSRWFTRVWTLQELIASLNVLFLSGDWAPIGPKYALADLIQEITGISEEALLHVEPLDRFSVAQRLSWASGREATKVEDKAYSLLGIFDINMPTLYGEGNRAFRRLQEEIMQRVPDQSLFAWGKVYLGPAIFSSGPNSATLQTRPRISYITGTHFPESPFATAPRSFAGCRTVSTATSHDIIRHIQLEFTSTPYGIRTQFQMLPLSLLFPPGSARYEKQEMEHWQWYLAILGCEHVERPGHLLGRVCYIPPSNSDIKFVYPAYVLVHGAVASPTLFPLPPETIESFRQHIQLMSVYLPHPEHQHQNPSQAAPSRAQHGINLLLLARTREALRAQGYTVDFRGPEKSHRTGTHYLTLARNDKHDIVVELQHILDNDGMNLTINARVAISQHDVRNSVANSESESPGADPSMVSWNDSYPWRVQLGQRDEVKINTGGAESLFLRLSLDLLYPEAYILCVTLSSEASRTPSSSSLISWQYVGGKEFQVASVSTRNDEKVEYFTFL